MGFSFLCVVVVGVGVTWSRWWCSWGSPSCVVVLPIGARVAVYGPQHVPTQACQLVPEMYPYRRFRTKGPGDSR